MCILNFKRDLSGLKDAQALQKSFLDIEHGRRDFERNAVTKNLGSDFYGWLAGEEDFNGAKFGFQGAEIAKYFAKYGKLMDTGMVGDEMKRMHDQQVRQLALTVSEQDEKNLNLQTQMEVVQRNAEADRLQQQEAHNRELEAVRGTVQRFEDAYNLMEKKDAELAQCEKESNLQSEAEKIRLESQMMENRAHREMVYKEQGKLKQNQEEARVLVERAHNEALQLAKNHKHELEVHQLTGMLEMSFDWLTIKEDKEEESKKIDNLKKQLEELESTQEYNEDTINSLVMKERKASDKIADGQKTAAQVREDLSDPDSKAALIDEALQDKQKLDKTGQTQQKVEVRRVGSIDPSHWQEAFRRKFGEGDDWQIKMTKALTKCAGIMRNANFQPYKSVKTGTGDDDWKQEIDHSNKQLIALKKELGIKVYKSVTTALLEIEEYNASGRYPIPVAWISEEKRRSTLEEIIAYLGEVIEALVANKTPSRRKFEGDTYLTY